MMSREEYEKLCKRCGRCCLIKAKRPDGSIYVTNQYCQYLEIFPDKTTSCRVYSMRVGVTTVGDNICLPIDFCAKRHLIPLDCPYARLEKAYFSVVDWTGIEVREK